MSAISPQPFPCLPPLGKPNPSEPRPMSGPDTRTRVVQLGSKDDTCWYAVFNMMRDRYKAPNTGELASRKIEKILSQRRKAASTYFKTTPDLCDQLDHEMSKKFYSGVTKELASNPGMILLINQLDKSSGVKVSSVMPAFLTQTEYSNLYDYLLFIRDHKLMKINLECFAALEVNPKDMFEAAIKREPELYENITWETLNSIRKNAFVDCYMKNLSAKLYNLKISSWHPKQPIDFLVRELNTHGRLAVGGFFGSLFYKDPPRKLGKKLCDRDIFFWKKSDTKSEHGRAAHYILIVWADLKTSLVYYIDPMDESDPKHPEKQRIFAMSYDRLTSEESIADNGGLLRKDAPPEVGYAYYRAPTIESDASSKDKKSNESDEKEAAASEPPRASAVGTLRPKISYMEMAKKLLAERQDPYSFI